MGEIGKNIQWWNHPGQKRDYLQAQEAAQQPEGTDKDYVAILTRNGRMPVYIDIDDEIAFELLDDMSARHAEARRKEAEQRRSELEALSDEDLEMARLWLEAHRENLSGEDVSRSLQLYRELGEVEFLQIARRLSSDNGDLPPAA